MVRDLITRRAGGSETTQWSQPGSRSASQSRLLGVKGVRDHAVVSTWEPLRGS